MDIYRMVLGTIVGLVLFIGGTLAGASVHSREFISPTRMGISVEGFAPKDAFALMYMARVSCNAQEAYTFANQAMIERNKR